MASKSKFDRRSRPLPDYSTKVRRWAALADANEIKELRAHAKRYALVLPAHLDAESILLELCVTTLQRMFRLRLTLYKTFGNLLFARSVQPDEKAADYGQPRAADFGTVAWSAETEDSPYLVCSDATSPRLLANFLRYGPWKIPRPDLLITVVGGARNFELQPPQLARLFSKGFGEAAIAANAVVTAAGTDAGVAKLVAHALAETGGNLPMIGVAPFSKMLGAKELLEGKSGEEVSYTNLPAPITDEAPLNPDHTHFIFVDSGKKTTWGTELRLRAEFEAEYAKMLHIPVAQLCVQGGPGTVQGLYESALKGTPIVIVAESGGCATDMYNFVMKDIELPKKYGDLATKGSLAAMIAEVKVLHEVKHNGRLLSFFSLERGDVDLAAVLLRAVVNLQAYHAFASIAQTGDPFAQQQLRQFLTLAGRSARDIFSLSAPTPDVAYGKLTVESLDPALTDQIGESAAASALRSRLQRSLARALKLAVVWGRVDVAKDILDLLGGMRKAYPAGAGSTPAAQEALQAAIQLGRFELCKALMDQPGADVGAIDVVQLYLNPGRFFFLSHNKILTEGLTAMFNEQKRRACLPETLADTKTSSVATLRHASIESDTRGIGVGRASLTMAANTSPPGNRSSPEAQEGDASIREPSLPGAKRKRGARDGARCRSRCA